VTQQAIPLSKSAHADFKLKPMSNLNHLADQALVRLMPSELPRAAHDFPIVFMRQDGGLFPAALLGLKPGVNQFVDKNGRWLASYMPALMQCYPFSLAHQEEGQFLPMIDADALSNTEGNALYTEAGELAEEHREKISTVLQAVAQLGSAAKALASLEAMDLIIPWDISLTVNSAPVTLRGFFRADEQRMKNLSDAQVLTLWHSGALPMLYTHWFSLSRFSRLGAVLKLAASDASKLQAPEAVQ